MESHERGPAEVMAGFMCHSQRKGLKSDFAMANKPTVEAYVLFPVRCERLRIRKAHSQVHVVDEFGEAVLKSLDQASGAPPGPSRVAWPEETRADVRIEERHLRDGGRRKKVLQSVQPRLLDPSHPRP